MGDLDGKVAIVTGAGRLRGIGRASAVALAMLGANVTITGTGRDPSTYPDDEKLANWRDIESTAEQVTAAGSKCLTVVTDITDSKDVQRMVDLTLDEFGRVDILINNAAFTRGPDRVPVVDMDDSIFQRVLDIKIMENNGFKIISLRVLFVCSINDSYLIINLGTSNFAHDKKF